MEIANVFQDLASQSPMFVLIVQPLGDSLLMDSVLVVLVPLPMMDKHVSALLAPNKYLEDALSLVTMAS